MWDIYLLIYKITAAACVNATCTWWVFETKEWDITNVSVWHAMSMSISNWNIEVGYENECLCEECYMSIGYDECLCECYMSIWNNEVGYDECLWKCYMSIWNNEVGYDECLCKCYMSIGNNEVGYEWMFMWMLHEYWK
jgi:hypothetical protein